MSRTLRIVISAIITLLVLIFLATRPDFSTANKKCDSCITDDDCESFCAKICLKKVLDKVTYTGEVNKSAVYCECMCKSSIKEFLT